MAETVVLFITQDTKRSLASKLICFHRRPQTHAVLLRVTLFLQRAKAWMSVICTMLGSVKMGIDGPSMSTSSSRHFSKTEVTLHSCRMGISFFDSS